MPWVGGWIKSKLAHLLEDFNAADIELDIRRGILGLKSVRVAADALQNVSDKLCCAAPLVVKVLRVGQVYVQLDWKSFALKISLEDVDLQLETQSAADWDITKAAENFQVAKTEALRMHSSLLQQHQEEGAGYFHSLTAAILDELEFFVDGLMCQVADTVSLLIDGTYKPFRLGAGVRKVELAAGQSKTKRDAVLRRVLLEYPSFFLDVDAKHSFGPEQLNPEFVTHDWILKPYEEICFEMGLLQCRRPLRSGSLRESAEEGFNLIQPSDFAQLAGIMHDRDSAGKQGEARAVGFAKDLPLPASAAVFAVQPLRLELSPKKLEALTAFAAFVGLGYGVVLEGVRAKYERKASAEELEKYAQDWLMASLRENTVGSMADKVLAIEDFEREHAFEALIRAREDTLNATLSSAEVKHARDRLGHVQAAFSGMQHLIFGRKVEAPLGESSEATWQDTAKLIRETLMMRDPAWHQSWLEICKADGAALLFGGRCMKMQVDIALPLRNNVPSMLSLHMDEIVFSAVRQHDGNENMQASLFEFRVEDNYSPQKLARLSSYAHSHATSRTPLSRVIVTTSSVSAAELDDERRKSIHSQRSELYFHVGRKTRRRQAEDPDGWLRLRSFGAMHICLPVHQLLVLFTGLLPASTRKGVRMWFAGVPWRSRARESVVALADSVLGEGSRIDFLTENWQLDVDMEPVHVLMPLPSPLVDMPSFEGSQVAETSESSFGEVFDLCLGNLSACSRIASRSLSERHELGEIDFDGPDSSSLLFTEYSSNIQGISCARHAWVGGVLPQDKVDGRVIVPTTSSKFSFLVAQKPHTGNRGYRKIILDYHMETCETHWRNADIEAIVEVFAEGISILSELLLEAAVMAKAYTLRHLQELALHSASQTRTPKVTRGRPKLAPVPDIDKLWHFILHIDRIKTTLHLDTEGSGADQSQKSDVVLTVDHWESSIHVNRDGSMRVEQKVPRVDLRGSQHKLYVGGKASRIRSSEVDRKNESRRRYEHNSALEDHVAVAVHFVAPSELGGEWSCLTSCRVNEPTLMIWWSAMYPPLKALTKCLSRAISDRRGRLSSGLEDNAPSQKRSGFQRLKTAREQAKILIISVLSVLPDHMGLIVNIQRGHLLLPCDAIDDSESERPTTPQVLSTRATVNIELHDLRISRNEACTQIEAFPEFDLRLSCIGLAADFILPPPLGADASSRHLQDVWNWAVIGRSSSPKVLLLSPCRSTFICKASSGGELKVRLRSEPITLHVYPVTRFMFMDLAQSGVAQFIIRHVQNFVAVTIGVSQVARKKSTASTSDHSHAQEDCYHDNSVEISVDNVPIDEDHITFLPKISSITHGFDVDALRSTEALANPSKTNVDREVSHVLMEPSLSLGSMSMTTSQFSMTSDSTAGPSHGLKLFLIPLSCSVDALASCEAVQIKLSELPGAAQQLHADMFVEGLLFHSSLDFNSLGGKNSFFSWRSKFESVFQANCLDALSLQTEPIIEPTCLKWNIHQGEGKRLEGSACITWINLNLPLGLFYSARLWMQSDKVQKMKREYDSEGGGEKTSWFFATNTTDSRQSRSITLHHETSFGTSGGGAVIIPDLECEIINKLGQPIAVKQLDNLSTVTGKYCYIPANSTHRPKVQSHDVSTAVPTVPRLAIRTVLWGEVMEIVFQAELQVPQFEVVRIEHNRPVNGSIEPVAFSLIFRAIPDNSGRGCALFIAPSIMVRNTTSLHVNWSLPEPPDIDHHSNLVPDSIGGRGSHSVTLSENGMEDLSRPPSVGKKTTSHSSHHRTSKVRAQNGNALIHWSNAVDKRSTPPLRKSAVTFDDTVLKKQESLRSRDQRLGPGQHVPLSLPWIIAASDLSQVENLTMSIAGSTESEQVLPTDTLINLGRFDFDKAHYSEEQHLGGSLIRLTDEAGEPVHLCCTVTVGLQAENAVCLEIVVSSCFLLVNHLPLPIKFTASNKQGERRNPKKILAGSMSKEYLAADFLSIDIETPSGVATALASKLKCKKPFKESVETTWKTQSIYRQRTGTLSASTTKNSIDASSELDKVMSIRMLSSSAFDLDTPLQGDSMDAWMQTLSWIQPKGWETYRRAITVWVPCIIENYSTCDLWFKAAGARKLNTASDELAVTKASWRILPAHLSAVGKMRMGTKSGISRKGSDTLRWQSRMKNTKKVQHLECMLEDDDGEKTHVYFGVKVDRGPMPFAKTTIIQIFDNLTIRNRTDQSIRCEIPTSSTLPLKFISRSKYLARSARNKAKVVKLDPQSQMRLDTDAPVFAFCANAAKRKRLDDLEMSANTTGSDERELDQMELNSTPSKVTAYTNALAECTVVNLGTEKVRNMMTVGQGTIVGQGLHQGLSASAQIMAGIGAHATSGANFLCQNLLTFGKSSFVPAAFVDITRPTSFQIRARYAVEQGIDQFENFRVSVERSYQGSVTMVNFDTAEPRFYVHNSTMTFVEIWQQNVPNVREILPDGATIPFVWYDPDSPPFLVARPVSCSSDAVEHHQTDSTLQQVLKFTKVAGKRGKAATTQTHDVRYAQDKRVKIVREFDSKTGHEVLKILNQHDYRKWLYKSKAQRKKSGPDLTIEQAEADEEGDFQSEYTEANEKYKMRPGIKFVLEGLGASLVDTSQVQVLYAACDNLVVQVAVSTFGSREAIPLEFSSGSSKMSFKERLQTALAFLPAVDFSISLQNFQVDSHIPGSFFPCVLRPLHAHSRMWRSLQFYSPNPPKNMKLKDPVMRFDVVGCQLLTRTTGSNVVVVNSCIGGIAEFVVNIDEAFIVGICSYYCRIAIYFKLPPFKEEQNDEEDSPRKDMRFQQEMSLKDIGKEMPLGGRKDQGTNQLFLISAEDVIEIKETTSYLSLRLMESANTYVEDLQNDEHVGVLLGMLTPLYAAALFQPAMISTHARALTLPHPYMSVTEFLKLIDNHFVAPMQTRIGLLLFISFDFIGNPRQLLLGILAGFRELIRQPCKQGICTGLFYGIIICLSSIFGSVFDSISRIINSAVKRIDWFQRLIHRRFDVREARRGADVFALSRMPVNWSDGVYRGASLALLQSRRIFLTMRQLLKWYRRKSLENPERVVCYTILLLLAWAATFALGMIEVVLLFLYNVLQGCVSSLYRRSAEAVCDWAPLQLMALELPVPVRPQVTTSSEQDGTARSITSAQFAYLPALVQSQLQPEAGLALPWHWHRCKDDEGDEVDDTVISAIWCGKSSSGDSETQVLVETGLKVSLLEIRDWGHLTASGRPRRPKAAYKWLWHIQRSDIVRVGIKKRILDKDDWVLVISQQQSRSQHKLDGNGAVQTKLVHFSAKLNVFRAFEVLSRIVATTTTSRVGDNTWGVVASMESNQSGGSTSVADAVFQHLQTLDLERIQEVNERDRDYDEETWI